MLRLTLTLLARDTNLSNECTSRRPFVATPPHNLSEVGRNSDYLSDMIATIPVKGGLQHEVHSVILANFQPDLVHSPRTEGIPCLLPNQTKVLHLLGGLQEVDFGLALQVEEV